MLSATEYLNRCVCVCVCTRDDEKQECPSQNLLGQHGVNTADVLTCSQFVYFSPLTADCEIPSTIKAVSRLSFVIRINVLIIRTITDS